MSLEQRTEGSEDKTTPATKRKTKRTRELIEENERQKETLKKQHEGLLGELEEHRAEQKKLGERKAIGMTVSHKKFGAGTVTKEDGKYIEVTFTPNGGSKLVKTFVLPGAIAGGFLVPDDDSAVEYYKKSAAIYERIMKTDLQLRSNGFATERVEEQLEKLAEMA
ncbi:MAG: hypothetical protein K6C95_06070 [Lachnospiraceae bacterium]|nr:hypothetical protein [Lachnospiraceae bacterium]